MVNSYLNVISFLLTTFFYYNSLKPTISYDLYSNTTERNNYITTSYMYLAIYVFLVVFIQVLVNSYLITSKCGGTITYNMKNSGYITVLPWIFIFGVLVLILNIYPGFKLVFSDVIGYYYVSNATTKIINELLSDVNADQKILEDVTLPPEKQETIKSAFDTIEKICGDTSILINQIVPNNFDKYWDILTPLMKDKYKYESPETDKIKNDLFNVVLSKDNMGESIWYIYIGILLTIIIQYKITNYNCNNKCI
jgi:hypothetical protein